MSTWCWYSETGQYKKMESQDPPLTTVVKIEIDVAEEPPVSWVMPTTNLGSGGESLGNAT